MMNRLIKIFQLGRQAFGNYKKSIALLIFLGLLSGIASGVGINALIPIFSLATGNSDFPGGDLISELIRSFFTFLNIDFRLKYLLVFVCVLFVFQAAIVLLSSYIIIMITSEYERKTRNLLFHKTIKASWPYLLKLKVGYLENVIMNDVKYSGVVLNSISGLVIVFCSLLVYILVAINISLVVTSITFIFGLIYLFLARPLLIKTKAAARENVATNKQVAHYVNENVIGMKTIKVFAVEDYINELVKKKFLILRNLKVKVLFLGSIGGSIMQLFSVLFIGVIFIVFYKITDFNLGSFLALVYLIQKIFTYFGQLQNQLQKAIEAVPYLMSVLNFEEKARQFKEEESGKVNFQTGDTISFNQVNFSYNLKKVNILNKINFNIKKGEIVGIIGPSGAGKTTIVDLVLRLFNPTAGKILLGDRDIKNISIKEWRDKIGYVSQDIFLVNDTIENNIRFYNDLLTYADIEEASKKANIYNFIMSTSAGFQTLVGERGNLLSGGQRQRIVIARVLARRPEILILDEATSALDNESESQIQRVIENLKGKMTVLIVAHRLSTISNCDRLLVLNDGEIVEEVKPDVLLQDKDSYFYKVYNR